MTTRSRKWEWKNTSTTGYNGIIRRIPGFMEERSPSMAFPNILNQSQNLPKISEYCTILILYRNPLTHVIDQ